MVYVDSYWWVQFALLVLINAGLIVLLVFKIKTVFYARSWWFLVIELWITPIGLLTLTPEIKAWEESEENLHNHNNDL